VLQIELNLDNAKCLNKTWTKIDAEREGYNQLNQSKTDPHFEQDLAESD